MYALVGFPCHIWGDIFPPNGEAGTGVMDSVVFIRVLLNREKAQLQEAGTDPGTGGVAHSRTAKTWRAGFFG